MQEVYNSTLERNWGFVPITMDELLSPRMTCERLPTRDDAYRRS